MALTQASATLLSATVLAASSGTRGAPGQVGSAFDNRGRYKSPLHYSIKNAGAVGVACALIIQASDDGTNWYDYYGPIMGDTAAYNSSTNAGLVTSTIALDPVMYARAVAYGNTTNNVDVVVKVGSLTAV